MAREGVATAAAEASGTAAAEATEATPPSRKSRRVPGDGESAQPSSGKERSPTQKMVAMACFLGKDAAIVMVMVMLMCDVLRGHFGRKIGIQIIEIVF